SYRFLTGWRPPPLMREQVYRFDPSTGDVRVVADHNMHPNGIAFTPNGKTAYVMDTGSLAESPTFPATIYQYDVNPSTHSFDNCIVFAYIDSGVPDGITIDSNDNIYAGCGDGTHVWNPEVATLFMVIRFPMQPNVNKGLRNPTNFVRFVVLKTELAVLLSCFCVA
ncbi:hypothetical protein DFH29DRAFT_803193, partial [Suillus ampliporus]